MKYILNLCKEKFVSKKKKGVLPSNSMIDFLIFKARPREAIKIQEKFMSLPEAAQGFTAPASPSLVGTNPAASSLAGAGLD